MAGNDAPRLKVRDIAMSERPVRFRLPFRFGAVTVEGAPQLFVHVEIEVKDRGRASGAAAELLVPKWFNKDPALTGDQTVEQLRRALAIARDLYLAEPGFDTAFGVHAARYDAVIAACGRERIPPLAAAYGPAEIDKAILDALLRCLGRDVFSGLAGNIIGLDRRLTPDLDPGAIEGFLGGRTVAPKIAIRHTIGLTDPLDALATELRQTGSRYVKIKLGGDPAADRERLKSIAAVLELLGFDYRATVDANEQYADLRALAALIEALRRADDVRPIARRLLYIEQPCPREATWTTALGDAAKMFAFIIDEADDDYGAFSRARALGYRGTSSKACKGYFKALLNGARSAQWNHAGERTFMAAEDLSCQPGLALQQDTALVTFLGIGHAERNGHHYVDGFADTPDAEAQAFLEAHADLYVSRGGRVRLKISDGCLATGSLACPGFACAVAPERVGPGPVRLSHPSAKGA
jgi:hypothetical protein